MAPNENEGIKKEAQQIPGKFRELSECTKNIIDTQYVEF
jgi:hypothetical protein